MCSYRSGWVCRGCARQPEVSTSRKDSHNFISVLDGWFKPGAPKPGKSPHPILVPKSQQEVGVAKKQLVADQRHVFSRFFKEISRGGTPCFLTALQKMTWGYGVRYGEGDERT